jgi:dephospho-CoA kinase
MRVIGAIGYNGSGKDEVLKYLRDKYHVPFFSTGDMVRAIAHKEGKELNRENLQNISTKYFAEFGKGYFVKLLAAELQKQDLPMVGISGIRSADDVRTLKETFGSKFVLIHVYIKDPQMRFHRLSRRSEERDPHTYEQFL